jgi:NhaP-type Na+/H+ or K+/H+ antiporter
MRAGLSLDLKDLKKIGRPALLISFVPASLEIIGCILLAPLLLDISVIEAAILGTVIAAVSPAVIVPKMLMLMENGYGRKKSIPQLIMAGASVDDIYAVVILASLIGIFKGSELNALSMLTIPISIITGIIAGFISGIILVRLFTLVHMRDTVKILLLLGVSFLIIGLEDSISSLLPFSGLPAVMALGGTILKQRAVLAKRIQGKYSKIWVAAELILFVLIGAAVDVKQAYVAGLAAVLIILGAVLFRAAGVLLSLIKSNLSFREKLFCIIGFLPKATVQAAVGGLPLVAGIPSGNIILSIAVLSIIIMAPIGAIAIDISYKKLLHNDK